VLLFAPEVGNGGKSLVPLGNHLIALTLLQPSRTHSTVRHLDLPALLPHLLVLLGLSYSRALLDHVFIP